MKPLVVVGDALLDRDVLGSVDRVAPDAPVPVLAESEARDRPGGAALAAALAASHDRPVRLITGIGRDEAGDRLRELLDACGVELVELPYRGATPEKIRLCADRQVMLRLDRGSPAKLGNTDIRDAIDDAGAVLVSDYGRGVTSLSGVRAAVERYARKHPVVWDPHPRGSEPVRGVRLATPNQSELPAPGGGIAAVAKAAHRVREQWNVRAVAVTLGARGALLASEDANPMVIPPPVRAVGDTCGAGDRFAIAATAALADNALLSEAIESAVALAAGFVAAGAAGTYRIGGTEAPPQAAGLGLEAAERLAAQIRGGGGTVVATGGCFDLVHAGHVATLEAARTLGDCLIVCLNSDRSVGEIKGPERPIVNEDDRARLLSALSCVDAVVIFDDPTPLPVLDRLRPDIWVKGGDYFLTDAGGRPALPEADLLRTWDGQVVIVPYLAGRSTTRLIQHASEGVSRT